jgi:hypothetical protein
MSTRRVIHYLTHSFPAGLASGMIFTAACLVPFAASAANAVALTSRLGAANVSAGDSGYHEALQVKAGQIIKLQLRYRRADTSSSGSVKHVNVRFAIPSKPGAAQTVMTTLTAPDGKQSREKVDIHLASAAEHLQYIPGSAVWRHHTGSGKQPKLADSKLTNDVGQPRGGPQDCPPNRQAGRLGDGAGARGRTRPADQRAGADRRAKRQVGGQKQRQARRYPGVFDKL